MMKPFFLGLMTGAAAAWMLKDSISTRIEACTASVRARSADRLRAAADAVEGDGRRAPAAESPARVARVS